MILPDEYEDGEEGILALTEHVSRLLETFILKQPEHWFWVHRRWKGAHKALKSKEKTND